MSTPLYVGLVKTLDEDLTPPRWPMDVRIVPFEPDLHAFDAHLLLTEAYQEGGGKIGSFEDWWGSLLSDSEYDPALLFVALDDDLQIVGFAQCWTSGYVKDVGVRKDRRREGIGESLLRHVFNEFQKRGLHQVMLKVEIGNPSGAEALYRRLGMIAIESGQKQKS